MQQTLNIPAVLSLLSKQVPQTFPFFSPEFNIVQYPLHFFKKWILLLEAATSLYNHIVWTQTFKLVGEYIVIQSSRWLRPWQVK